MARPSKAYPRSHGATLSAQLAALAHTGLSPLARGNLHRGVVDYSCVGPIPARTGQPSVRHFAAWAAWAYPRSHGATGVGAGVSTRLGGLSPLARGNRQGCQALPSPQGPIPARTGQPGTPPDSHRQRGAYPRSHGATKYYGSDKDGQEGLSPLARGNLIEDAARCGSGGPIPARTGQPRVSNKRRALWWAYPRSHGATKSA